MNYQSAVVAGAVEQIAAVARPRNGMDHSGGADGVDEGRLTTSS